MLRPTLNELLSGMQRTIIEALMPELTSPYAQGQAMSAIAMIGHAAAVIEATPAYDAAEIKDLRATFAAIKRLGDKHVGKKGGMRGALGRCDSRECEDSTGSARDGSGDGDVCDGSRAGPSRR